VTGKSRRPHVRRFIVPSETEKVRRLTAAQKRRKEAGDRYNRAEAKMQVADRDIEQADRDIAWLGAMPTEPSS